MLSERAKGASDSARIEQSRGRSGGLLFCAPHDGLPAIRVEHADGGKPFEHGPEVTQGVTADAELDIIGVDEIEPEAITNEDERTAIRRCENECESECGHGDLRSKEVWSTLPTERIDASKKGEAAGSFSAMNGPPLLPDVHRVVVGSTNPVKIAAVQAVIGRCVVDLTVHGVAVPSGVPDQPWGDSETRAGAIARARAALVSDPAADLGIGLEGGVVREADGTVRTCAWAAIVDRAGAVSTGGSLAMPLPPGVVALLESGVELGHAMDQVAQTTGTKHGVGAVGLLTGGLISRQAAYEPLVTYALARWLGRALWDTGPG